MDLNTLFFTSLHFLATVSRAGMIYFDALDLGWEPMVVSWLERQFSTSTDDYEFHHHLFDIMNCYELENYLRDLESIFPSNNTFYDYYINPKKQDFELWENIVPNCIPHQSSDFEQIFVPTIDTTRTMYILSSRLYQFSQLTTVQLQKKQQKQKGNKTEKLREYNSHFFLVRANRMGKRNY